MENVKSGKFPCPSCGGDMVYKPETKDLECTYCGSHAEIESSDFTPEEYRIDQLEDLSHKWGDEKRVIKCSNCSGETVIGIDEVTSECVFCGSHHVVTETLESGVQPESLIPFQVTTDTARVNFKKWAKGKFFAPNDLRKKNLNALKTIYIPSFTYDSNTISDYSAQKGTHYTVTRTKVVNGKTTTVREQKTRWRRVTGTYREDFDDVLIHASNKVEPRLIKQMQSFDLSALQAYQEAYLVGHPVERYKISIKEGWSEARDDIDRDIVDGIRRQVNGDEFRLEHKDTDYGTIMFKHILLPVWLSTYYYKDKLYNVYVNGQNGRVVGTYPKSAIKIALTILVIAIIILSIYYFGVYEQA